MKYVGIRSEGGLIPYDTLDQIAQESVEGQKAPSFGLSGSRRISDEISTAWSQAQNHWSNFSLKRDDPGKDDPYGTTLTRRRWITRLLEDCLDYSVQPYGAGPVVNGKTYAISHRAGENEDAPAVHIEGFRINLDERLETRRMSAHALVQQYLNVREGQLWGIVTNGLEFRLLRQATRSAKPSYVEFDLESILDENRFNEFTLFYRLCHRTRLPKGPEDAASCLHDDRAPDIETEDIRTGVRPFVRDTRNLLLAVPLSEGELSDAFLYSLGYALQRGMQVLFQVEQQEIVVEEIGEGNDRRLLFWEAAEGGNGIWQGLLEDRNTLARVAEEALKVCHFDPATGDEITSWADKCSRACYECLLSYSNQPLHPFIDRHAVRDFLLLLKQSTMESEERGRSRAEQYQWLEERRDRNSSLEGDLLKLLYDTGRRLPDRAQYRPSQDVYAEADFYYERDGIPGVYVLCDGPEHDDPGRKAADEAARTALRDLGYRVMVIRHDYSMDVQLAGHEDVFGQGTSRAGA